MILVLLNRIGQHGAPVFDHQHCTQCRSVIRGCMFKDTTNAATTLCESCYRDGHYGADNFGKVYKHCILDDAITSDASRRICNCTEVPRFDAEGRRKPLYPINPDDEHRASLNTGGLRCGLLKLGERVAMAKYQGLQSALPRKADGKDGANPKKEGDEVETKRHNSTKYRLKEVTGSSLLDSTTKEATKATTIVVEEEETEADADIPFYFKKYTDKYSFGNVHMSLRFGPLVIENGVKQ
jgi:hypothetical protein